LHLVVEIKKALLEGLVDIGASMFIMVTSVVRELIIMHLILRHETYKTTSSMITQAFGRIIDITMMMGKVVCQMIFLIVEINNYGLFLRLDFFMKIKVVVDVEKGVIQVRNGLGMAIEVLSPNELSTCYKWLQRQRMHVLTNWVGISTTFNWSSYLKNKRRRYNTIQHTLVLMVAMMIICPMNE
jgi:hypothetical protein